MNQSFLKDFKTFFATNYLKFLNQSKFITVAGIIDVDLTSDLAVLVLRQKIKGVREINQSKLNGQKGSFYSDILKLSPKDSKVVINLNLNRAEDTDFNLKYLNPQSLVLERVSFQKSESDIQSNLTNQVMLLCQKLPKNGLVILNGDDPTLKKISAGLTMEKFFFGTDKKTCSVWAGNIKIKNFQTSFELNYGVERVEINSKLLGVNQVYPLLGAAALGISLEIPLLKIKKGLETIPVSEHRMEVLNGSNGSVVIDDTINSIALASIDSIDCLNHLAGRRRVVVLGDFYDLDETSSKDIARKLFKDKVDLILLAGGNTRYVFEELQKLGFLTERIKENLNITQVVSHLLSVLGRGDMVLIEGSGEVKLDEVVRRITKKGG